MNENQTKTKVNKQEAFAFFFLQLINLHVSSDAKVAMVSELSS